MSFYIGSVLLPIFLLLPTGDRNRKATPRYCEQLAWSRETHILNKALMEACNLVWNRAASDCAWPVGRLKPGKLLWRLAGATPADEERRCLQELTRLVEGVMVNMQNAYLEHSHCRLPHRSGCSTTACPEKEQTGISWTRKLTRPEQFLPYPRFSPLRPIYPVRP